MPCDRHVSFWEDGGQVTHVGAEVLGGRLSCSRDLTCAAQIGLGQPQVAQRDRETKRAIREQSESMLCNPCADVALVS